MSGIICLVPSLRTNSEKTFTVENQTCPESMRKLISASFEIKNPGFKPQDKTQNKKGK